MSCFLYENHWGSLTLTLLNVYSVLGVLNVLHVLHTCASCMCFMCFICPWTHRWPAGPCLTLSRWQSKESGWNGISDQFKCFFYSNFSLNSVTTITRIRMIIYSSAYHPRPVPILIWKWSKNEWSKRIKNKLTVYLLISAQDQGY